LAPIYNECNLSVDQNLLLMSIMKKVARRHSFRLLLHEKPFAGINGSGKHCNWSLSTDTGIGLFTPGKTPEENLLFITFVVNVLMAVYKNNSLIKASIMTAQNAHRLGANEAPPAIISVFLGEQLSKVLDKLEISDSEDIIIVDHKKKLNLKIPHIPEVLLDNTDRNRTSPFAFTGNRFEFRAMGSSANCSTGMIVLSTALAAQLLDFKSEVDKKMEAGLAKQQAIFEIVKEYIQISKSIRFEGNNYSEEWKIEAKKRGLDCETSVPKILKAYLKPQSVHIFSSLGILSEKELYARNEVKQETYTKKIQIESRVLGDLAVNHIIPVAIRYQTLLAENVSKIKNLTFDNNGKDICKMQLELIREIAQRVNIIKENVNEMIEARKKANIIENEEEKANAYHDTVLPYFDAIRYHIDKLEMIIDDEMWPLPKYREILFIR
ncbi:MAG TPA: glutamine synthetase type III, partial [Paludibacteraceae bacterium]|nr:glutamine synthetase type III [Paludibacteraceae bacterium]